MSPWGIAGTGSPFFPFLLNNTIPANDMPIATGQSACHSEMGRSDSETDLRPAGSSQTTVAVSSTVSDHDSHIPNRGLPWTDGRMVTIIINRAMRSVVPIAAKGNNKLRL